MNAKQEKEEVFTLICDAPKLNIVFMSTVIAHVIDIMGWQHNIKAILDTDSQASYISEACVKKLKLPVESTYDFLFRIRWS